MPWRTSDGTSSKVQTVWTRLEPSAAHLEGVARHWDAKKGFGFIRPTDSQFPDFFVHRSGIQSFAYRELRVGEPVLFVPTQTPRGPQAVRVLRTSIDPVWDAHLPRVGPRPATEDVVAITLVEDELKLLTLHSDGRYEFADQTRQTHEILFRAARTAALTNPIATFERLLTDPRTREAQLQDFFEENPRFLMGDQYSTIVPHLVLTQAARGPLIPDFALRPHNPEGLCDLMELKLPSAKLVVGPPNRRRLTADVLEAAAQLREYRDYFELPSNRDHVERTYGLKLFRPRMIVVIGRRSDFDHYELRSAEQDVPHLSITTYDDLLLRAKSWNQ